MSQNAKNIPFSSLKKEVERNIGKHNKKGLTTIDLDNNMEIPMPEDVRISYQRINLYNQDGTPKCFHRFFVLKFHLDNYSKGYVESNFYTFKPKTGMLIFPYQLHHLTETASGGQLRLLINFTLSPEHEKIIRNLKNKVFEISADDCRMMQEIIRGAGNGATFLRARCMIGEFLLKLLNENYVTADYCEYAENIHPIFHYLSEHYSEQISVKTIAERFHCSESGLRKMFHRETGRTPGAFLHELRLNLAAKLLRKTNDNIDSIVKKCGFSNRVVFSRAFKKRFHLSPVRFRKEFFEYV